MFNHPPQDMHWFTTNELCSLGVKVWDMATRLSSSYRDLPSGGGTSPGGRGALSNFGGGNSLCCCILFGVCACLVVNIHTSTITLTIPKKGQ
jgi:hypothetical protein